MLFYFYVKVKSSICLIKKYLIVFSATIFKLGDFVFNTAFFAGVLSSFLVGLVVIKFLLDYLKKGDFKWFAIYRIVFGIIILVFLV